MTSKDDVARTISRNSLYTVAYNVWYLGSRLALTPLILSFVTIQEYGLWSYCFVVLSYLALTAFGFNNTYIRYAADYRSRNENDKLNALLSTGIITMMGISLVLFPLFWALVPWLVKVLGIDPALQQTSQKLMIGTGAIFVLNFCLSAYQYILEGEQRISLVRKIHLVASVAEIVLILLFFKLGMGVFALLWAYAVRLSMVIVCCIIFANRIFPFLSIRIASYSKDALKKFLGFGNEMNLLGLLSLMINSLDRIFITRILNLEAVGIYEIGRKLPNIGLTLPASIAGTLMPAASHLQGSSQKERLEQIYLSATRYLMMLSALPYAYLIIFAAPLIEVWVGPGFGQAVLVMQVLAVGTFINLFTGIGTACVRGIGKPVYEIKYMAVSVALILILVPILVRQQGIAGAAWAYCIGQTIGSLYFLAMGNRLFEVSWSRFASQVLPPVVLIFALGWPASIFCNLLWPLGGQSRWVRLAILMISGLVYLLACLTIAGLFKKRLFSRAEIDKIGALPLPGAARGLWKKIWSAA